MRTTTLESKFWAKVQKTDNCWQWQGLVRGKGYGVFRHMRRRYSAHRVSYALHYGDFDKDLCVCHRCDNPRCVRPDHLFLGTNQDNVADKMAKGRHRVSARNGEEVGTSKLTLVQVVEIREKYCPRRYTQDRLAAEYGVHQSVVSRVLSRRIWSKVD